MPEPELIIDSRQFDLLVEAASKVRPVEAQIVTSGKPEDYWIVLERGSKEGQRPWPQPRKKTRFGANRRIFSKQAPQGFVMHWASKFIDFLAQSYRKVADATGGAPLQGDLQSAVDDAAEKSLDLILKGVPVDSGALRDSLKVKKGR